MTTTATATTTANMDKYANIYQMDQFGWKHTENGCQASTETFMEMVKDGMIKIRKNGEFRTVTEQDIQNIPMNKTLSDCTAKTDKNWPDMVELYNMPFSIWNANIDVTKTETGLEIIVSWPG
jgi:hypothetical protein